MPSPTEPLIPEFLRLPSAAQRYRDFALRAEQAASPYLARFFRALAVSETYRDKLVLHGLHEHAADDCSYFVCPHCGLIFIPEPPEKCPVDDTPGAQFEAVL